MKVQEMYSAKALATYWTETASNRTPYLGTALFPPRRIAGLDLSWIKGRRGLPIALKASNFDSKAELRDRIGVSKIDTEMPFFREAFLIKEKDRQELLKLQAGAEPAFFQSVINNIYNDGAQLINGAMIQMERMRMQLLQGGKISLLDTENVIYTYDFDQAGEYAANNTMTLTGTDMWSDTENSNPVEDIQDIRERLEMSQGVTVARGIMTRKTWNYLMQNKRIKLDMNAQNGQNLILTDTGLEQYLIAKLGMTFVRYDKKFVDEKGVTHNFFEDGNVAFLPDGTLGSSNFGTTPEEADLMGGNTDAQVAIVENGVALTTITQPHPVNIQTIVSSIGMPSFEGMDDTFLLKAY